MATYAIGDVQGCYDALAQLLDAVSFDPAQDHVIFCGDLVNRGGQSLQTLRLIRSLGSRATSVLGNHDLAYLAQWFRKPGNRRANPEMRTVFKAPDAPDLMDWLHARPFMVETEGFCVVHAGVHPRWTLETARSLHAELLERRSVSPPEQFYRQIMGYKPRRWRSSLRGWDRFRLIVNAFTRIRFVDDEMRLDFEEKGSPGSAPKRLKPWFDVMPEHDRMLIFGHWSTLGLRHTPRFVSLDTGCVWGGRLTAVRLDEELAIVQTEGCAA